MPDTGPPKVGTCYCGCGERTAAHFARGHSARAAAWLEALEREPPLAAQLFRAGYGPGQRNLYEAAQAAGLVDS